jgi:uncharacterized membrane protein (DUF106 family)
MTYFILGIIVAILLYMLRSKFLVDKDQELMLQLKEQEKKTQELEQKYEEAKNKFTDIANKYKRESRD